METGCRRAILFLLFSPLFGTGFAQTETPVKVDKPLNRIHIGILEQNMVSLSCLAILLHSRRIKPMSDLSLEGLPVIRSIRG